MTVKRILLLQPTDVPHNHSSVLEQFGGARTRIGRRQRRRLNQQGQSGNYPAHSDLTLSDLSFPWRRLGRSRNSRLDQFLHESGRQRVIRLKTNRALAGLIVGQLGLEGVDDAARKERAMACGGRKPRHDASVETKCRNPVADALLGPRKSGTDRPSQFVECGTLVGRYRPQGTR